MRMTPNLKLVEGLPSRKHPLYNTFSSMKDRCNNPNCKSYPDYGGRGIIVCQRWKDSFADFVADMGIKLDKTLSIDRIDNDGDYEPSNTRWATKTEQACNTRLRRDSQTGHKGIGIDKNNHFRVRTVGTVYARRIHLGTRRTLAEAIELQQSGVKLCLSRANKSGATNVKLCKNGRYVVRKTIKGKQHYIGMFNNMEDAKEALSSFTLQHQHQQDKTKMKTTITESQKQIFIASLGLQKKQFVPKVINTRNVILVSPVTLQRDSSRMANHIRNLPEVVKANVDNQRAMINHLQQLFNL